MEPSLRVARVDVSGYRLPTTELEGLDLLHRELQAVIRRHLPGVTASVFAMPVPCSDGKTVDWYSDLPGQPTRLTALPAARRAAIKAKLEDRLDSLRRLADALPKRVKGSEPIAAALRVATHYPDDSHVYVIGDEPVLTLWGFVLVKQARRGPALGAAASIDRRAGRRRPVWVWAAAVALMLGLGLAGGLWYWLDQREADSLAAELQAAIDADCEGPDRLGAFGVRLDRLDPAGEGYSELRERLAAEQGRCAAAAAFAGAFAAAGWDCSRLEALRQDMTALRTGEPSAALETAALEAVALQKVPIDPGREPFTGIAAGLDGRIGVCTKAAATLAELDRRLGDCEGVAELDRAFGLPALEDEPLRPVRDRLDRELALCAAADRFLVALDAALEKEGGDCPALSTLDRESAGLDATRPPLAPLRERLDAELARCARAQIYRQRLVDAQMDCIGLRALDRDLAAEETEREPLRSIRLQLDGVLGRCDTLEKLEQSVSEGLKQP